MVSPPSNSIQFIDSALSCTGTPFALSYSDPDQKWLIRKHLFSLLQDYPTLNPAIDTFNHNDGTTVNLLNAEGYLFVSHSLPLIALTIWIHENYPHMAPLVFVSPNPMSKIHPNHPFVDSSGATTTPYLQTWLHPGCNLRDLVHNLVKLFAIDHPLCLASPSSSFTHPSLVTKREALDRLTGAIHYDIVALQAKTEEEIEELSNLQGKMVERVDIATSIILGLDHERLAIIGKVKELTEEADVIMNWLRVNDPKTAVAIAGGEDDDDAFEAVDEESNLVLDSLAADVAIEDLIYALDKAVQLGVVDF
uniref:UEV domain-containing protein n=1 Tax=Fagus sylvatica TaxID=28930 RepID=A0A2N9G6G3_FAGSY